MDTVGDAYDNAMAESFSASLEAELIKLHSFESKAQACRPSLRGKRGGRTPGIATAVWIISHP